MGDSTGGSKSEKTQEELIWERIAREFEKGFARADQLIQYAEEFVDNLKSEMYEVEINTLANKYELDPMLLFTFALAASKGSTVYSAGLLGMGNPTGNIKELDKEVKAFADKCKSKQKGSNVIGLIQSYFAWGKELDKLNNENTKYDIKWFQALQKVQSRVEDGDLSSFACMVKLYNLLAPFAKDFSAVSNNTPSAEHPAFPVKNNNLSALYLINDYGFKNADVPGINYISTALLFKFKYKKNKSETNLMACQDGTVSAIKYSQALGNHIELKGIDGNTYIFGRLNSASKTGSVKKGDIIAVSSEYLLIQVNKSGEPIDPKSFFEILTSGMVTKLENVGKEGESIGEKITK